MDTAAAILFVAVALTIAVHLLAEIWPALCLLAASVGLVAAGIALYRRRYRGW